MGTMQQKLEDSLAKEFQKTIDYEVLGDVLLRFGWTRVKTEYDGGKEWMDVVAWVGLNCQGEYKEHNGIWLFERSADAVAFQLRWA